jgi:predicted MFS family arabinose efflux permease
MMLNRKAIFLRAMLLALGPAVGIGIARFAYGMVLPAMKTDLGWTYLQSGLMNTVNALGYLAGAFLMGRLARRFGANRVFYGGILVTVVAILLIGTTGNFLLLSLFRLASGLSGAAIFVAGGAIVSSLASGMPQARGTILSMFYAGPGLGIALTALVVPPIFSAFGPLSWRIVWVALGLISFIAGLLALFSWRPAPPVSARDVEPGEARYHPLEHVLLLAGYTLFAAGAIGYMTFMVTSLQESGTGASAAAFFWLVVGLASIVAPLIWGRVLSRLNHGYSFALLSVVNALGALLPLLSTSSVVTTISALIFGSSFFTVVATTTAFAARNVAPPDLPKAISYFTIAFGSGQSLGPIVIGMISDHTGSVEAGLALGVGVIMAGAVLGSLQRDRLADPFRAP